MSLALASAVVLSSLLGSLHCVGMCGGIAAFASPNRVAATLYHMARGLAYLVLGAIAGSIGAAIDFGGEAVGWSRAAMVLAGSTMLLVGLHGVFRTQVGKLPKLPIPRAASRLFGKAVPWASRQAPELRALWLGGLTALLPCGWLYAFVLVAAGSGSPWGGVAVMAAFWVGTVPALLFASWGARGLLRRLGRHAPRWSALALVALGLTALWSRHDIGALTGRVAAAESIEEVLQLADHEPACCEEPDS